MQVKIAMVGEKDAIMGFKPLGIEIHPAIDAQEAEKKLKSFLSSRDYAAIYLTESLSSQIPELITELIKSLNIIVIPAKGKALGLARERLRKISEKALGTDVLSSEE